ncbi:hypothetical protein ACP275_10G120500 [Erythranthe tilingii]
MANLELVPVLADEQEHGYIPLHKFIQQPTPTLRSFVSMDSNNSTKMLIPRISDQQDDNEGISIPTVSLSGKENWIIRRLPRSKPNRWDSYYVHLRTDVQFRSLKDVHTFIIHGILPERRKGKLIKEDDA